MRANLRGKAEITKQFAKNYTVSQIGSRTEIKNCRNKFLKRNLKEKKKEKKKKRKKGGGGGGEERNKERKKERKTKHWLKQKQKLSETVKSDQHKRRAKNERTEKDN